MTWLSALKGLVRRRLALDDRGFADRGGDLPLGRPRIHEQAHCRRAISCGGRRSRSTGPRLARGDFAVGGGAGSRRSELGQPGRLVIRRDSGRLAAIDRRLANWTQPGTAARGGKACRAAQRREEAKEGLGYARDLANRPRGRFPGWRVEYDFPPSVPRATEQVTTVFRLLYLDALICIEEADLIGAAADVKAIINAGRADRRPAQAGVSNRATESRPPGRGDARAAAGAW